MNAIEPRRASVVEGEVVGSYRSRTPKPPPRRAILHLGSEQLAALLRLPDDVTVTGFTVDPVRDAVSFRLDSDRFAPVAECAEPPGLIAEVRVKVGDDGTVTQYVTWPGMDDAGFEVRHEPPAEDAADERGRL